MIYAITRLFDKGWKGEVPDPKGPCKGEGRANAAPSEPQEFSEEDGLRSEGRIPEETQALSSPIFYKISSTGIKLK